MSYITSKSVRLRILKKSKGYSLWCFRAFLSAFFDHKWRKSQLNLPKLYINFLVLTLKINPSSFVMKNVLFRWATDYLICLVRLEMFLFYIHLWSCVHFFLIKVWKTTWFRWVKLNLFGWGITSLGSQITKLEACPVLTTQNREGSKKFTVCI